LAPQNNPKSTDLAREKKSKDTLDALLSVVELGELVSEYVLAERAVHGRPDSTQSSNRRRVAQILWTRRKRDR